MVDRVLTMEHCHQFGGVEVVQGGLPVFTYTTISNILFYCLKDNDKRMNGLVTDFPLLSRFSEACPDSHPRGDW